MDATEGTEASAAIPEDTGRRRHWLREQLEPLTKEIVDQMTGIPIPPETFQRITKTIILESMKDLVRRVEEARNALPAGRRPPRGQSGRERQYEAGRRRAQKKASATKPMSSNKRRLVRSLELDRHSGESEDEVSFGEELEPSQQQHQNTQVMVPTRTLQHALIDYTRSHGHSSCQTYSFFFPILLLLCAHTHLLCSHTYHPMLEDTIDRRLSHEWTGVLDTTPSSTHS